MLNVRISTPARPLTRREREDIADARHVARLPIPFHLSIVDERFEPVADTGLDLVVSARSEAEAWHAWERWAEDERGAVGVHRVMITSTAPVRGRARPVERQMVRVINLDALLLHDELDELDAADRALGL